MTVIECVGCIKWFKTRHLAFSMGIVIFISRGLSVLLMLVCTIISVYDIYIPNWIGTLVCICGFIASMLFYFNDKYGEQMYGSSEQTNSVLNRIGFIQFSFELYLIS